MSIDIKKHHKTFERAFQNGDYQQTEEGILFPRLGAVAAGTYHSSVNGGPVQLDHNLLPDAAILSILNVYFGGASKLPAWYMALFSAAVTPTANLTAANFASTLNEITSTTEGYSEVTRPQFTPDQAANGVIGNLDSKAQFTIATSSSVIVEGAALLSENTRGGTSGVLASAARFSQPRELFNGDDFALGYTVTLTG